MQSVNQHLADAVLIAHVAFVAFVVGGLLLTVCGGHLRWAWIRSAWFRWTHLAAMGFVVAQTWLGMVCPLTTLEMRLRIQAGQSAYDGSFIQYWLHRALYYDLPAWAFIAAYTAFGLLVAWAWVRFPPKRPRLAARGRGAARSR